MILYFSATGNCKYVASRLAEADTQESISIVDCINENRYDFEADMIGIVSPTYDWGLPSIVKEFLEKASFRTEYLFFVSTYGTMPGASGYIANKAIRGRNIDAYYSVRMVDTWTPIFDLSTPKKVAKYTVKTEAEIDSVIRSVNERHVNKHMPGRTPAFFTELIAEPIYNKNVRRTANFHVEESCIGCGLCERKCPVQAISGLYDAAILDIMMPVMDGVTVLIRARQEHNTTPVLLLTAKSEIDDKITGLDAVANDYLTKPFDMRELLARIRVLTRKINVTYCGDEKAIRELMTALLDNAFKYGTPGGQVGVTLTAERHGVRFSVQNTVSGIGQEQTKKFTERFYRSDTSDKVRGFGIGLSIARAVAEEHKGKLNIELKGDIIIFSAVLK